MSSEDSSYEVVESSVRASLKPVLDEFRPSYECGQAFLRLFAIAASEEASDPEWARVRSTLLPRVADDLRSVWLLGERGYVMQAATLAASAVESLAMVARVGRSRSDAARWLEWTELKNPPWSVRKACRGLDGLENPDLSEAMYAWYEQLCLWKHANPVVQKVVPRSLTPDQHYLNANPELTPGVASVLTLAVFVPLQMVLVTLLAMDGEALLLPPSISMDDFEWFQGEHRRLTRDVIPRFLV